MKLFKDISFWCIVLTIVIIMVIHHMLNKCNIVEGQDNMEETQEEEPQVGEIQVEETQIANGNVRAVIEVSLGRKNMVSGLERDETLEEPERNIDTVRGELRQRQLAAAGLSEDATDQEIETAMNDLMSTMEDPNSQGDIDPQLLLAIQEIESLNQEITQLNIENSSLLNGNLMDGDNIISLPSRDEIEMENYSLIGNGVVDCSNKKFLGVADTIRHSGSSDGWGEEMVNQIEGSGFTQTFKDNNQDIPCSDYYYYKPHTSGNNGWDAETETRGEAPSGFYVLERGTNEEASDMCTNESVRTNSINIINTTCSDQTTKNLNDPGRLNTNGSISNWTRDNGLDISATEAIIHGLGMTPSVQEITERGPLDGDNVVVDISSKTPNPEGNLKSDGTWYKPLDGIDGEERTSNTWQECQQRCLNTEGCVYFNSFTNGDCHITDGRDGTSIGEYRQEIVGPNPQLEGTNPTIKSGRAEAPHTGECSPVNLGNSNRVKGSFNATCNDDGKENDYCRFIGDGEGAYGEWLSCVSPENNCREDPLTNSKYAWNMDMLPDNVSSTFANESEEVQREAALKNFFDSDCKLKNKCPHASGLPDNPNPEYQFTGEAGYSNRARGFFDASCNGEENDYCRFVGSSGNLWLSCWSPTNENGCANKYPAPNEELGWHLDNVDLAAKIEVTDENSLNSAKSSLRNFFEDHCNRPTCEGGIHPNGCETLNDTSENKGRCGEGGVFEESDGVYKQCFMDATDNTCRASENSCKR